MQEYYNEDCMQGMKRYPDKYFDLAIVDPPYGIGYDTQAEKNSGQISGKAKAPKRKYHGGEWDIRPPKEYFDELMRVSVKQIIWGGNYFSDYLPPSKAFVCWDKKCSDQLTNNFADCEYAWCSESLGVARVCRYVWSGMIQGNMKTKEDRIHPTQKPVALYKWLLTRYAKQGDIILDTHCGSASSLIACEDLGFDYVAFEIDATYYKESKERLDRHRQQISIMEFINDWRMP